MFPDCLLYIDKAYVKKGIKKWMVLVCFATNFIENCFKTPTLMKICRLHGFEFGIKESRGYV